MSIFKKKPTLVRTFKRTYTVGIDEYFNGECAWELHLSEGWSGPLSEDWSGTVTLIDEGKSFGFLDNYEAALKSAKNAMEKYEGKRMKRSSSITLKIFED